MGYTYRELDSHTVEELREMGKTLRLKSYSTFSKAELIGRLMQITNRDSSSEKIKLVNDAIRFWAISSNKTAKGKETSEGFLLRMSFAFGVLYDQNFQSTQICVPHYIIDQSEVFDGAWVSGEWLDFRDQRLLVCLHEPKDDQPTEIGAGRRSLVRCDDVSDYIIQSAAKPTIKNAVKIPVSLLALDDELQRMTSANLDTSLCSRLATCQPSDHGLRARLIAGIARHRAMTTGQHIILYIDLGRFLHALRLSGLSEPDSHYAFLRTFTSSTQFSNGGRLDIVGVSNDQGVCLQLDGYRTPDCV